jgi:hypothetical protein
VRMPARAARFSHFVRQMSLESNEVRQGDTKSAFRSVLSSMNRPARSTYKHVSSRQPANPRSRMVRYSKPIRSPCLGRIMSPRWRFSRRVSAIRS